MKRNRRYYEAKEKTVRRPRGQAESHWQADGSLERENGVYSDVERKPSDEPQQQELPFEEVEDVDDDLPFSPQRCNL